MTDINETADEPEIDVGEEEEQYSGYSTSDLLESLMYRREDSIADRTGEVMRYAVDVAREFSGVRVVELVEPDTGVKAPALLRGNGEHCLLSANTFNDYRSAPKQITGLAGLTRLPSFIDHVNRFKRPESALFASDNPTHPSLTAVFDYHNRVHDQDVPAFGRHIATYRFPLSEEWKAWVDSNGKRMDIATFAAFLEDRIIDVELVKFTDLNEDMKRFIGSTNGSIGTPTKLVELSRGITIHENSVVTDVRNLSSGEGQISFQSEHSDQSGATLAIPTVFVICIPVFSNSEDFYRMVCRLRYRKTQDGVVFWYELWRSDRVFLAAFDEAIEKAKLETALPLFMGTHES